MKSRALLLGVFLATGAHPVWAASAAWRPTLPHGVAAGDVTQDSVVLWARTTVPGQVRFDVATSPGFATLIEQASIDVVDCEVPAKIAIRDLNPGTRYFFRVTSPARDSVVGKFRTAATPGSSAMLRFGVSGDWSGDLAPFPAIRNIPDRDLDCFVALGDTIYADDPSPAVPKAARSLPEFRSKHAESLTDRLGMNTWSEVRGSTAFYAMIDDHEIVNDFAGGALVQSDQRFATYQGPLINDTTWYRDGLKAFQEYMPIGIETWQGSSDPRMAGKPRLYRYRTFGQDAAFFLLDARSFRDAPLDYILSRNVLQAGFFLLSAASPGRTMLGRFQLDRLKADLEDAERKRVRWKFIFLPQPIQNLGVVAAADRYEGYGAERSELLGFIAQRSLKNVVFVTADFHGMLINDLGYSWFPFTPQTRLPSWEIVTGPVAVDPPFGPSVAQFALKSGIISAAEKLAYDQMSLEGKDRYIQGLVDRQLRAQGLGLLGLGDSGLTAGLTSGSYVAVHSYGWTEFEIFGTRLVVKTYGIDPYSAGQLETASGEVLGREPRVLSDFWVEAES